MIWKQALPEGRFVHVQCREDSPEGYLFSSTPIPGTLHACSESRKITIATGWSLQFGTESYECEHCEGCEGGRAPDTPDYIAAGILKTLGIDEYEGVDMTWRVSKRSPKVYRTAFGPGVILSSRGPELFGPGGVLFGLGEEIFGSGGELAGEDPAFFGPGGPLGGRKGRVWFNFDKDVLYFPSSSTEQVWCSRPSADFTNAQLHKFKKLALRANLMPNRSLYIFPNVEELFLVSEHLYKPPPPNPHALYRKLILPLRAEFALDDGLLYTLPNIDEVLVGSNHLYTPMPPSPPSPPGPPAWYQRLILKGQNLLISIKKKIGTLC